MNTVGYKKVQGAILEVLPVGTEVEEWGGAWRAPAVEVLRALPTGGKEWMLEGTYRSLREASCLYTVGQVTRASTWDELGNDGIYYYRTFEQARRY